MGYDDVGRLLSANCGSVWSQSFSYDPYGNITKSGSSAWIPGYNATTNHYTLSGVTYDSSGDLTNDTFHAYTWDSFGKPIAVDSSTTVTYDAFGRAVEKTVSGVTTQMEYSPAGKVAVMSGSIQKQAYVPLPGGEMLSPGPDTFWHRDWLGSVRLASSVSSRTVTLDRAFAPFGEMYNPVTGGTSNPDFTGDTQDTISGEFDTPFRELHPGQGRWISPDPAGLAVANPANPQSWNLYAYVANEPNNLVDPSGLWAFPSLWYEAFSYAFYVQNYTVTVTAGVGSIGSSDFGGFAYGYSTGQLITPRKADGRPEGGGGGTAANNGFPVHRTFQRTFQCSTSASGVMNALESNFASFANNPTSGNLSTFSIFTPGPASPGGQIGINVGVQAGGHTFGYSDVSVTVQSATSSQLVFQSDPGHVLYPATVSFSASDAGNGSITFTTSVTATTNGLWGTAQFYLFGGRAGESSTWNNLLNNVAGFCAQPSHP